MLVLLLLGMLADDKTLYLEAHQLAQQDKEEEAHALYQRLLAEHPGSKFVPDVYLALAEAAFMKGEMESALGLYRKVDEFTGPQVKVRLYAAYKQGWCLINLGRFRDAQDAFARVIKRAESGEGVPARAAEVARHAKFDFAKAYASAGDPARAWDTFRAVGGELAPKMVETLAGIYAERSEWAKSSALLRRLLVDKPGAREACAWQKKIVANTLAPPSRLSEAARTEQIAELRRLGDIYQRLRGDKEECRVLYHDTVRELALVWHKSAQKTKDPDLYADVAELYRQYLAHFENDKSGYEMAYYYAEVLWVTESWREAAEQYTRVVEMAPRGKYLEEAAYAAMLASKNALDIDGGGQRQGKRKADDKDLRPRPIPDHHQKMIAAFDAYIRSVPDSDRVPKIKYRKARIYYEHNRLDQAADLFLKIVQDHRDDEVAIYSANLHLDCLNLLGRRADVCRRVDDFLNAPELQRDPEFVKQMRKLRDDCERLRPRRP